MLLMSMLLSIPKPAANKMFVLLGPVVMRPLIQAESGSVAQGAEPLSNGNPLARAGIQLPLPSRTCHKASLLPSLSCVVLFALYPVLRLMLVAAVVVEVPQLNRGALLKVCACAAPMIDR